MLFASRFDSDRSRIGGAIVAVLVSATASLAAPAPGKPTTPQTGLVHKTQGFGVQIGSGGVSIGGGTVRRRSGRSSGQTTGRPGGRGRPSGGRRGGGVGIGIKITPPSGRRRPSGRRIVACRGGRITSNGRRCVCPRGTRRRGSLRRGYRCVGSTPPRKVATPSQPITCRSGRVRGNRCICASNRRRVQVSARVFRCVRPPPRVAQPDGKPTTKPERGSGRRVATVRTPRIVPPPPVVSPARPTQPPAVVIPDFVTDEVLVSIPAATPQTVDDAVATTFALELIERQTIALLGERVVRYRVPDARDVPAVVAALAADPRVTTPQPNYIYRRQAGAEAEPASFTLSETAVSLQYALVKLGARDALALASGRGARVAVIDSGVDHDHEDLDHLAGTSLDVVASDPRRKTVAPLDDPHGTAVAGIIAAQGLTTGIAPAADILSVRAFATDIVARKHLSTTMRILKGLDWAITERARVVNMSFAGPRDGYMARAVDASLGKGAMIVAAAGNAGPEAPEAYPAAYQGVLAVTATDADDIIYAKANRGTHVTISAPGVDVLAPALENTHQVQAGTSFAAAYVSGVLALMLEREPELTLADARTALITTAVDLGAPGHDPVFGAGRVDAAGTLKARMRTKP